jgi:hypothetical protein
MLRPSDMKLDSKYDKLVKNKYIFTGLPQDRRTNLNQGLATILHLHDISDDCRDFGDNASDYCLGLNPLVSEHTRATIPSINTCCRFKTS